MKASAALVLSFALALPSVAGATDYDGNPGNYLTLLGQMVPGDSLRLAAGTYTGGLPITNKNGSDVAPFVIEGPATGPRAVFPARACCNTVAINNSSYVAIRNLELDGLGMAGVDAVKAEGGEANFAHHIALENLYIHGHDGSQQTVGISTKCPAWNWLIRGNVIWSAGTGIYLGNSDGSSPFANALIEGNLIVDTTGYNMQIKHQNARLAGMPASATTVIRHNVFSKENGAATGADARPNLLVGHWPLSGAGSSDTYQIYGNFFWANPTGEPLFQGEGNIALYDNVFVNPSGPAVWIQPHEHLPRSIRVFSNTVVAQTTGIRVSGAEAGYTQHVYANASFAATPLNVTSAGASLWGNIVDSYANAGSYLNSPYGNPTAISLDVFPRVGMLRGPSPGVGPSFYPYLDWTRDFNGNGHNGTYRGAYAGEGANPGWLPRLERKPF